MTPGRWAQIEELFHRAVETAPEERSRLLEDSCAGDPELRREVEALLSGARSADHRLWQAVRLAADSVGFPLVGRTVSHYRILEGLGGGGMGVVYKAQDAKLPRLVALKLLPEYLAQDYLALERFTREANAASSLNHPNICTVYEFGEHEGLPFIAMELLDGQTLRQVLERSKVDSRKSRVAADVNVSCRGSAPLPIDTVLDLAIQIAEGLEAAHSKGITHRDIKPANIFITTRGGVKILDFGLAKLAGSAGVAATGDGDGDGAGRAGKMPVLPDATSHRDSNISRTGVAMGTAPYMSPEQVRGEKLDARTDLFSFGLVLYEMATGRAAFAGETAAEVYEAILNQTPAPARSLSRDIPPKLQGIIHKALEKDREKRYQSAPDLGAELRRLVRDLQSHNGAVALAAATMRRRWLLILGLLAFVLATAAGVAWFLKPQHRNEPELTERELTANPPEDYVSGAAISPDGKHVAYVDETGLYVRSIDSGETRAVSVPRELVHRICGLRWLPEGGKLLATVGSSDALNLWVITILGEGAPHLLYRGGESPAVSPDGRLIAFASGEFGKLFDEVVIGDAGGETRRTLVPAEKGQSVLSPVWSPDSRWIAYLRDWKTAPDRRSSSIEIRPAGGGPAKTVVAESSLPRSTLLRCLGMDTGSCFAWSPDWRLVFAVSAPSKPPTAQAKRNSLWAVRVQPQKDEPADKPQPLAQTGDYAPRDLTVSADGKRLSFLKELQWDDVYLAELTPEGLQAPRRLTLDNRGSEINDWTHDSQAVLFSSGRNGKFEVFRQRLNAEVAEAIVEGPGVDYGGAISPDGAWLLYEESIDDAPGPTAAPVRLMRWRLAGGSPELVLEEPSVVQLKFWCPLKSGAPCVLSEQEGDCATFYSLDPVRGKGDRLAKVNLVAFRWFDAAVSPDGSRLALVDPDKHHGRIEVLTLSDRAWHELSVEQGWGDFQSIAWAAYGRGFFITSWLPDSFNLLRVTLAGQVQPLLQNGHRQWIFSPRPSPDGRRLAYQAETADINVWLLENF